ncbi:MAG: F0F1 ATP synthase subunit A [Chloroflexi bacterium]|nr:F0F1 ATP synthase subunit A [Chloroflexota bacterium]
MWRILIISLIALALIVVVRILFPFPVSPITVAAEPLPGLVIPGINLPITNSLLTTWIAMVLLIGFALWAGRNLKPIPTGKQNAAEMLVEGLYGLVESIAGPKWAPSFFPTVTTIFLFVLVSNWIDLLTPILAAVGFTEHGEIIPILRSPSTDLNFTLGLALISVVLTQYYGIRSNGLLTYLGRFINLKGIVRFFRVLTGKEKGNAFGALFMGLIDFYMGLVEIVSEVAKIISFSFRLFGNIFAGEVLLLVIPFLLSFLVPLPFLGLETFVGLIQAFIFAVLTLAFMSMATVVHGGSEHAERAAATPDNVSV